MVRASDEGFFKNLIDQKEKEIVKLWEQRIHALEEKLLLREADLSAISNNFAQLQEDFQYNLSLLEARDAELEAYDASFSQLQEAVVDGERLLKDARSALADAEANLLEERRKCEESDAHSKQKVVEAREALEQAEWRCDEEMRKQRQSFEAINGALKRQVAEAQEQLDLQRRELTRQYEENLRVQENESQLRMDEAVAKTFAAEQQKKKLERTLRLMEEGVEQLQADSAKLHIALEAKEREAEALVWEVEKVRGFREAEGAELQTRVNNLEKQKGEMEADFEQKTAELVAALSAVQQMMVFQQESDAAQFAAATQRAEEDAAALRAKLAGAVARGQDAEAQKVEQGESLRKQVRALEAQLEAQSRAAQRSLEDAQAANREHIQRLETDRQELTDQLWHKGTQLDAARSKLEALQRTLDERRADVANYKEQLVAGAAREKELQRQVVQATLRGEQDADEKERRALSRSEALIVSLQQQRDHANALHKQAEERAAELANELQRLVRANQQRPLTPHNPSARPSTAPTPTTSRRPPPIAVPQQGGGASSLGSPLPAPSPIPSLGLSFAASPRPSALLTSPKRHFSNTMVRFDDAREDSGLEKGDAVGIEGGGYPGTVVAEDGELEEENDLLRQSLAGLAVQNEQIRAVVHQMRGEMEELQKRAVVAMTPREPSGNLGKLGGPAETASERRVGTTELRQEKEGNVKLENVSDMAGASALGSSAPRPGVSSPEVEQLREELENVQQRLAQMSARLEPVLTTVQTLQHHNENVLAPATLTQLVAPGLGGPSFPPLTGGEVLPGFGASGPGRPNDELTAALQEVQRLAVERDRLMELSNALRADLKKRVAVTSPTNPDPGPEPKPPLPPAGVTAGTERRAGASARPPPAQTKAPGVEQGTPGDGAKSAGAGRRMDGGAGPLGGGQFAVARVQAPRTAALEVIHKGTVSQRASLRATQQRRQDEAPKVRNYNIRDDGEPG